MELFEAREYYFLEGASVVQMFNTELRQYLRVIEQYPSAWPEVDQGIRRCPLQQFPISIIYSIIPQTITVISLMHQHRKPIKWQDLIK